MSALEQTKAIPKTIKNDKIKGEKPFIRAKNAREGSSKAPFPALAEPKKPIKNIRGNTKAAAKSAPLFNASSSSLAYALCQFP